MPELSLTDRAGVRSTLTAARGAGPAVVFFLRSASCPVCVRHARALVAMAERGELADHAVMLVVPGGAAEAGQLQRRLTSGRITAWASGEGHAAAGLGTFLSLQHSGTFVLSAAGAVVYRRTSLLPTGSFSAGELLKALVR
jgi:peroxiredoxin